MKIIFLDFDGVINDLLTFNSVNRNNVMILKKIIELTDAKVVVTSSNKYSFQRPYSENNKEETQCYTLYIEELNKNGITIHDFTSYVNANREQEILEYLKSHPDIEQYLILDDDYVIESCKEHEVYLDLQSGLREEHIIPALNILNGKLKFYHDTDNLDETQEERIIRMNQKIQELQHRYLEDEGR
ncbi:MAG: hypothetical protein J5507_02385 [Clostridia bacterium]|nr:hypothetical protein [Clostridia bacterium]